MKRKLSSDDTGIIIDKLDITSRSKNIILEIEFSDIKVSLAKKNDGLSSKRMIDFEKKFVKSLIGAKAGAVYSSVPEREYRLKITIFDAWKKSIFYSSSVFHLPIIDKDQMKKFIEIFFEKFPSQPATYKRF